MSSGASGSARTRYAILGCGSVGHAVAEELTERGKDVLILDRDESRVEALRDQDLNARVQDIAEPDVVDELADRDIVLILASDVEANKAAVSAVRETGGDHYLVARASDPVSEDELRERGADVVINPSTVIADSALQSLETGELEYMARQLAEIVEEGGDRMAILTHDNPEPDSIASATALQAIAEAFGVDADIIYSGDVGHQENRAFVNLLGIDLLARSEAPPLAEYATVAAVDLAKAAAEDLDLDVPVDIYLDHLEAEVPFDARFVDVRTNVSSTSTILTKYLQ